MSELTPIFGDYRASVAGNYTHIVELRSYCVNIAHTGPGYCVKPVAHIGLGQAETKSLFPPLLLELCLLDII